jgi:hypothetical protein
LHSKEEESGSVKSASCVATTAGPTPAAGEDSARRIRARVSYFENSLQKSKGCDWLREASASIRQAGVHGGLAEAIAFANATRYRIGETAQWTARWRQNQRKPHKLTTSGPLPVACGNRRKTKAEEMYLSMEVVPDRRATWSSRTASRSALGADSMCGPLRRDAQAGTSRRRDRHESGSKDRR